MSTVHVRCERSKDEQKSISLEDINMVKNLYMHGFLIPLFRLFELSCFVRRRTDYNSFRYYSLLKASFDRVLINLFVMVSPL